MAIYTRFGTLVTIVSAAEVPVWIERTKDAETKWHYKEPKRLRKGSVLDKTSPVPVWHARMKDSRTGKWVCDGGEIPGHELKADNGWSEIVDVFKTCVVPTPVEVDSRICFGIAYFETEADAEAYGRYMRRIDRTYNGGWFHGTPCGRDKSWDREKDGRKLYACTE